MTRSVRMRRSSAFTLIELLVVISIISLLISILVPSLQGAREHAKRLVCQSNMKNINTSLLTYVSEFDNFPVPFKSPDNCNNVSWATWAFGGWTGKDFKTFCNSQATGTFCYQTWQRPLSVYMMEPHTISKDHPGRDGSFGSSDDISVQMPVYQCPSDTVASQWKWQPGAQSVDMSAYDQAGTSYQMNYYWFYQANARAKLEMPPGFYACKNYKEWSKSFEIGTRIWRSATEQGGASRFVSMVEDPFDWGIAQNLANGVNATAGPDHKHTSTGIQTMGFHKTWSQHMMAFLDGHVDYLVADTRYQRQPEWTVTNEKWWDTKRKENCP